MHKKFLEIFLSNQQSSGELMNRFVQTATEGTMPPKTVPYDCQPELLQPLQRRSRTDCI